MERQDYPAILPQIQPPQAVDILNERVQQVGKLNTAIADWLLERKRIEAQYSASLRKLSQRQLDGVDLGVFSVPWTTLTGSADTMADSHAALAMKIETDVEQPLRNFAATNREMIQISTIQGNLAALAKDVERAQSKTDKLQGRGGRAEHGKIASANSDLDSAQAQWENQAPYVFESLQSLDETRLNHLRDALTQFQTHEVDQVERDRITAEQCLNVLLNVETSDEIKSFAQRAPHMKPTLRSQRNSIATPSRSLQAPVASAGSSALTPTLSQDEDLYTVPSSAGSEDKQKGRLKGLRRLGTVMGRRSSKIPPGATLPSTAESPERPERKQRPTAFNAISGRFGKSRENAPTLDSLQETSPRQRPRSPPRLGSELFSPPPESRPEITTPIPNSQLSEASPQVNGVSSTAAVAAGATAVAAVPATLALLNGSHQNDLADLVPPKPAELQQTPQAAGAESQKDSEGFSVPPQDLDPITRAQQEAAGEGSAPFNVAIRDTPLQDDSTNRDASLANAATKLQAPPTTNRRAGTVRGRRDNRNSTINSTYIPPEQPITESDSGSAPAPAVETDKAIVPPIETSAAVVQPPSNITSASLTQSPSGNPFGQVAASTFSPFSPQAEQQVPSPLRPDSRAATGLDSSRGDNQSIRSATTSGSQGAARHPELHETGLNSSVIETVTARFDNGKLTSSSMIGEIALAYNAANFSSPFGTENIRLENFSSLEKVAPNPAFINQLTDAEGEYSINLSTLGKTQIAFKYQVRLEDSGSQAPLLIAPAFRPETNQFSVIISYSLNPQFDLKGEESLTLSNVTLALTLEGAKANSCLSKPVGTFARERNLIYWQLNDVILKPGAAPEKLLARFSTDSQASSGSVEARWEISNDNARKFGSGLSASMPGQVGGSTDPFADESAQGSSWKSVPGVKKLVSGSYSAK